MEVEPSPSASSSTEYFDSYENLEVHKLMLEDHTRTNAYRKAILNNKAYFKDKVVMDVGCGTGILSIFCAQAGAKKVYAVEASKMANMAVEIVMDNHFENVIEVIQSKVEDVVLPDNIKVDAIVSEWMGYYLLHEGMLDSVLIARDKFLKEDGQIFPESAAIYIAPCSIPALYTAWDNIHGVNMSSFARHMRNCKYNKPEIVAIQPEDLLAPEVAFCWLSLKTEKPSDLNSFTIRHVVGASKSGRYQGLCVWFECIFPDLSGDREEPPVILGTGPLSLPTHWKQTVIVLPQEHEVEQGEPIAFQLDMNRDKESSRRYNLILELLDPDEADHPIPCSCYMTKCILVKTYLVGHPERDNASGDNNGLVEDRIDGEDDEG